MNPHLNHSPDLVLVKQIISRTGVRRLWHRPATDEWLVSLDNRTYSHTHTIDPAKVNAWKKEFGL